MALTDILAKWRSTPGTAGSRRARGGFTLLEVMVVAAIIAVLIAVLLPALSQVRQRSRRMTCQAHLRTITQAWHHYLNAHNGRFLKSVAGKLNTEVNFGGKQGKLFALPNGSGPYQGPKPLNQYLGMPLILQNGAEVFSCPDDRGGIVYQPSCFEAIGSSYGMNVLLVGPPQPPAMSKDACASVFAAMKGRIGGLSLSQVFSPARVLLMGDQGWYYAWHSSMPVETHMDWHRAGWHNIAFLDDHVEFVEIRKGIHASDRYTVIPFRQEQSSIVSCQP